jgi:hypothetical protein
LKEFEGSVEHCETFQIHIMGVPERGAVGGEVVKEFLKQ